MLTVLGQKGGKGIAFLCYVAPRSSKINEVYPQYYSFKNICIENWLLLLVEIKVDAGEIEALSWLLFI